MLKQQTGSTAIENLEICFEKSTLERKIPNSEETSVSSNNSPGTSRLIEKDVGPNSTKCKICFLEFSCEYNLQRHEEYFSGSKYQCTKCETKFADKRQLRIHTGSTHSKKIPELRYRCHLCGQMFKHAINLQPHLYHYHGHQQHINIMKNGVNECTVNSEKTGKTVFIDDNYDSKIIGNQNIVASKEISLTSSRKSGDKRIMNKKLRNDKPKHQKFNNSIRKRKRKDPAGNARLITVLSEAAAIFSETDVFVPYENDYENISSKKGINIENPLKNFDPIIANNRYQNGATKVKFRPEMAKPIEPYEQDYSKIVGTQIPEYLHTKNKPHKAKLSVEPENSKNNKTVLTLDLKYGVNPPVISGPNKDPINQSASTCISLKASTTQTNPNTSVTLKNINSVNEEVLEEDTTCEIQAVSSKSENLYNSVAISVGNTKMENPGGTTIINGRNVATREKNKETKKSQKNYQNFIKSGNTDISVLSDTGIQDFPEVIEDENESLQSVMERIMLNKKRKPDVVQSYKSLNCKKTKRTDNTSTIRSANVVESEIIRTNVKKIGYFENSEKMDNIRIEYVIDYRDDGPPEIIRENNRKTERNRFFKNPGIIESDSVKHTVEVRTIENMHKKTDSFSNLIKFPFIKNSGKSIVPIDSGSALYSHVSGTNENPEKTAVFYITNDDDFKKVQATDTSIKNVENVVTIENRLNSIDNTNEVLHRGIQEIEKPPSVHKVSNNTENMILIVNPIPGVPKKPEENNESLNEKERNSEEFYSIPLMKSDECVGGSNVAGKTYECYENLKNFNEMERKEIGFTANENIEDNRISKIIEKMVASKKVVSSSSLSKFIEPIDGTVSGRDPSDSSLDDRDKRSEEKCDELRERYSCKDCYVSIPKMTIVKSHSSEIENSPVSNSDKLPNHSKCTTLVTPDRVAEATFLPESSTNRISDHRTIVRSVICSIALPTVSSMRQHYRDVHSIFTEERKSCACGKSINEDKEDHFYSYGFRSSVSRKPHPFIGGPCKPLKKTEICGKCGESFWLKACLEFHRFKCNQPSALLAKTTPMINPSKQEVARGPNSFKYQLTCPVCLAEFLTPAAFRKHVKIYAKPANHRCSICGTCFMGKRLLEGHERSAHDSKLNTDYGYNCAICDQGFLKAIHRRVHMMHVHGEKCLTDIIRSSKFNGNPIVHEKCKTCYREFENRERFVEHLIYYEKKEKIVCKICDKEFAGRYNAHRHNKLRHYSSNIRSAYPVKCPVCHEGFAFMEHFQAHVSHVHGRNVDGTDNENATSSNDGVKRNGETSFSKEKPLADDTNIHQLHICDICETSFPSFDLLVAHQVEYSKNGKFACNRCGKRCTTATLLLDHLSLNHSGTVYDSIKCHRCAENILTPGAWISHVKHYHASHVKEPSEFYFEINFSKEFGMEEFDLIPKNMKRAKGTTHELMGNTINRNGSMNIQNIGENKNDTVRSSDRNIIKDSTSGFIEFNTKPSSLKDATANMRTNGENKNANVSRSSYGNLVNVSTSNLTWKSINRESLKNVMANRKTNGGKKQGRIGRNFESSVTSRIRVSKIVKSGRNKANWKCDTCSQYFHGPAGFARHKAHYSNAGPHVCKICTRRFPSPAIFQEHKVTHERSGVKYNYLCGICNQRFGTLSWLKIHNAHLHPETGQIRKFNVNSLVQGSVLSSSTTISVDSSLTSSSNDTPCSTVTQTEASSLRIPIEKPDDPISESSETLLDNGREKQLALSNALDESKFDANNDPSYVYQCPNCNLRFYRFQQLREHFRSSHKIIVPDNENTDLDAETDNAGNSGSSSELEITPVAFRNLSTDQTSKTTAQDALPVSNDTDTTNDEN